MSLFRKPTRKIQRRVFTCGDEEEDSSGEPEAPPPPIISRPKEKQAPVVRSLKPAPLLSFADEEEDGEVFKVKKSTSSKRWSRRKEKEKKKTYDNDIKYDSNNFHEENMDNHKEEPQPERPKKKSLEGLILSGREALAADGAGDISDENDEEEEDTGGFPRFRPESVRAALAAASAPGKIPDAALIHAARKTRQKARELGGGTGGTGGTGGNDFIPLRSETVTVAAPGSRLVHEDDVSGDDEDEDRLLVRGLDLPSDKPKRGSEEICEPEADSDGEWAEQQMQKAVPAITEFGYQQSATGMDIDMNPFAAAPPPPRLEELPQHLRPLENPPATPADLLRALSDRLKELNVTRAEISSKKEELNSRLLYAARLRESRKSRAAPLDAAYRRSQAIRGYLTDLVECLDEKMPELETLESRALALHRRRCEFLQDRRRADVRDQAQDVLTMAARPGSMRIPDSEEKVRRAAEREGRRRARRLKREAGMHSLEHREGDSSDDELTTVELQHYRTETDAIRHLSSSLFEDALPAWRSVRGVCARLGHWRRSQPDMYHSAYVADCLPRLLAPYVRQQLILWNPLADKNNDDYERMDWYKCLVMYGVKQEKLSSDSDEAETNGDVEMMDEVTRVTEDDVRADPDLMLAPTIVQKVVLPKLTELVEQAWDPMSVRECVRLRCLLERVADSPPRASPELRALSTAARDRLADALSHDVFLPALPPHICEGPGSVFWRRCLGAGVRLLRAVLALCGPPAVLAADSAALALIGTICTAAGAAPPMSGAQAAAALSATLPRGESSLRARGLARLALLAQRAHDNLDGENPIHMKSLEVLRSVLAEARSVEHLLREDKP